MRKAQALVIYLSAISFFMVGASYALLTTQETIQGTGSIKGMGFGIYWDQQCTAATSSLDWGLLEPGSSTDFTLYLRNEGNSALTLSMASENWSPANATDYLTLTWNREGQQVNPDEVLKFVITLTVSADIQNIDSFSFDITISGTG